MRRRSSTVDHAALKNELARLPKLDEVALRKRWEDLYKTHPPRCPSRAFLTQAIAYRLQEKAFGGLRPAAQKALARIVEEIRAGSKKPAMAPVARIRSGIKLIRTWHGITYDVTVLDDGVLFRGERYDSLTKVAQLITGQHWSGPKFFGLKQPRSQGVSHGA